MADTDLQQFIINVGTKAQIEAGISGGTITSDMLSISTDEDSFIEIDEVSITKNSSDKIQTVGVIDQNNTSNAIKTWSGTRAQYDAIVSKDANTLYNITDDTDIGLNLLQAIYPVGSIYIGTMASCPLSLLFGTWTLVSSGRVLQGADANHSAGTSISAGLPNITGEASVAASTYSGGSILYSTTGSFTATTISGNSNKLASGQWANVPRLKFNASDSNSIYGNSTTVQPPAYVVNIWERTA